ncbi:hypothetical protein D7X98_18760 [bacterium 1XD8-76]|nr:hypothetical protein D7X98_18760 [bacterium 1XD8-76]
MKNYIRTAFTAAGIALMVLFSFYGWYYYETEWKDGGTGTVEFSDEPEVFKGYSEEEIVSEITARYDDISYLRKEGGRYYFQADGFEFFVNNDPEMTDNYEESYFDYLAQQFSFAHNRFLEMEKEPGGSYIPVLDFYGRQTWESEFFSEACCDLVEDLQKIVGFDKIGYFGPEDRCYFDLTPYLENYDRTELYNAMYQAIERDSLELWEKQAHSANGDSLEGETGDIAKAQQEELLSIWADYEADCVYRKKDGTELRMVGVDRAAGSCYYALLQAENGKNTAIVNGDPYLGAGGGAKWLDFLEDEKTGFSCLAYSGGSKGCLYRTEDGGVSFEEVTWPSGKKELPDGTLYNPFIMPEEVWEENGKLYMLVSQGPEGDYYEDGVWVYGLYESEDMGKNWAYTGTQEGEDIRPLW